MQIRVNIEFCLCCLFQRLVFCERREMLATDRMKHLRCRCLGEMTVYPQTHLSNIPQTQQLQMHVYRISVTAITMQCFSYAIRSQSVLTTIQLGVSTVFSTVVTRIPCTSKIACLHNFFRQALLSCSEILTYQLLGSQLWIVLC